VSRSGLGLEEEVEAGYGSPDPSLFLEHVVTKTNVASFGARRFWLPIRLALLQSKGVSPSPVSCAATRIVG
jgi:hypothetical protein